jgi:hypothetical protein
MKLVLHIGSGKTGTTSIQKFFVNNSDRLLEHGVFYPVKRSVVPNHILLPAGFVRHGSIAIPRSRFYLDSFDRFKKDYQKFKRALDLQLQKHKPNVLVLSAEQLFRDFSDKSTISLKDFLKPYFDEITVVAYVRDPASDYASRISQHISTGILMQPPAVRDVRAVLEYYESQFPGCVKVNAFERKQLIEGDVVADFVSKYVPEATSIYIANKPTVYNEGLPAELLLKLQEARLSFQPVGKRPQIETSALMSRIIKCYLKLYSRKGSGKVTLKQEVKDYLESSAVDYVWLRDSYGVAFNSLDYEKIGNIESKFSNYILLSDVATVSRSSLATLSHIVPSMLPLASFIRTQYFIWVGQLMRFYGMYLENSSLIRFARKWLN